MRRGGHFQQLTHLPPTEEPASTQASATVTAAREHIPMLMHSQAARRLGTGWGKAAWIQIISCLWLLHLSTLTTFPEQWYTGSHWTTEISGGSPGQPQVKASLYSFSGTVGNYSPGQGQGLLLYSGGAFLIKRQSFHNTGLEAGCNSFKRHFWRNNVNECSTISGNKERESKKNWSTGDRCQISLKRD